MSGFASLVNGWAALTLAITWQVAVLAALLGLAEKLFRINQPRIRYASWWLVLLMPLLIAPVRIGLHQRHALMEIIVPARVVQLLPQQTAPRAQVASPERLGGTTVSPSAPHDLQAGGLTRLNPIDLVALAWFGGCCLLGLRLGVGFRQIQRLLGPRGATAEGEGAELLAALCVQAGVKCRIKLLSSENIPSPVLFGWRKPIILLPAGWAHSLPEEQLRAIFAHEIAHIKRHDFPVNLFQHLIGVLLFFHPVIWLANRKLLLAREELSDIKALELVKDAPSYARSLTVTAERMLAMPATLCLGIGENKSTLLRRVETIMKTEGKQRLTLPKVFVLTALVLISTIAFAAGQMKDERWVSIETAITKGDEALKNHNTQEALTYYDEALTTLERLTPSEAQMKTKMQVLWSKGTAAMYSPGKETAVKYQEASLQIAQELNDRASQASELTGISATYANMGQTDKSMEYSERALRIYEELGDKNGQGNGLFWLGTQRLSAGDILAAKQDWQKALALLKASTDHGMAAVCQAALDNLDEVGVERLKEKQAANLEHRTPALVSWNAICVILQANDGKVAFAGQPGYGDGSKGDEIPAAFSIGDVFYEISQLRTFLNPSVRVGESWKGDSFSYTAKPLLTVVRVMSNRARVKVPAGEFRNCLLTETVTQDSANPDTSSALNTQLDHEYLVGRRQAWFAPGVGLVQLETQRGDGPKVVIQLKQCNIVKDSKTYLPLGVGNSWIYGYADVPVEYEAKLAYQVMATEEDKSYLESYQYAYRK
jgi:beta-lactamase regulating signal transducer with metallopeptidase domain